MSTKAPEAGRHRSPRGTVVLVCTRLLGAGRERALEFSGLDASEVRHLTVTTPFDE